MLDERERKLAAWLKAQEARGFAPAKARLQPYYAPIEPSERSASPCDWRVETSRGSVESIGYQDGVWWGLTAEGFVRLRDGL